MGAPLPDKLAAEGSLSGEVRYSEPDGFAGTVALQDASLTLPDGRPLRAASAAVVIDHQVISLEPSTVSVGENESADVEGSFSLEGAARLDLKITTRGAECRGHAIVRRRGDSSAGSDAAGHLARLGAL